jgi:hypothetical protein
LALRLRQSSLVARQIAARQDRESRLCPHGEAAGTLQNCAAGEHLFPTPQPTRSPPPVASNQFVVLGRFAPSKVEYAARGRVTHDCKTHHHQLVLSITASFSFSLLHACAASALIEARALCWKRVYDVMKRVRTLLELRVL